MPAQYCIGIDLGTTNCVLAFASLDEREPMIGVLPIPQLIAPGSIERRLHLPSFLYIPTDATEPSLQVPGIDSSCGIAGEYARRIAAEQPERVVAAAKSWLCHTQIDRQSAILPWLSDADIKLISPVDASAAYLQHLIDAWHLQFPDAPFGEQQVAITVPASFDVVARELTRKAALSVGVPNDFVFLEEPQAALYNWVHSQGETWREQLKQGDTILVCDVGGGTTDLTLVRTESLDGELGLNRLAVGNHLLVGGDNMDLMLAHVASKLFAEKGAKLNAWQSMSLWHSCRIAKEKLLSENPPESAPLTILGRGSRLIGGTIQVDLTRAITESVLVDGFFPKVTTEAPPGLQHESGFQELGLPYEADTAITRHIESFLKHHANEIVSADGGESLTHLLFNGGVFNAVAFRSRLIETLKDWNFSETELVTLGGVDELDQAVACGATYYLWASLHGGVRIRGGTARSYYVGIESSGPAIPGMSRPIHALCVVPQGMEEGSEAVVPGRPIGIQVGKRARFRFFSSTTRNEDQTGTILRDWGDDELVETSPMEVELPAIGAERVVPVRFRSRITELGVFELACQSLSGDMSWKLELNVRE